MRPGWRLWCHFSQQSDNGSRQMASKTACTQRVLAAAGWIWPAPPSAPPPLWGGAPPRPRTWPKMQGEHSPSIPDKYSDEGKCCRPGLPLRIRRMSHDGVGLALSCLAASPGHCLSPCAWSLLLFLESLPKRATVTCCCWQLKINGQSCACHDNR